MALALFASTLIVCITAYSIAGMFQAAPISLKFDGIDVSAGTLAELKTILASVKAIRSTLDGEERA